MSRIPSYGDRERYSEGELSDSPDYKRRGKMEDDISLSLSEEDVSADELDIKPPQPQAGYVASESKSTRHRDRNKYKYQEAHDQQQWDERAKGSKTVKEERKERRSDHRSGKDSKKEDLRERLERERRLKRDREQEGQDGGRSQSTSAGRSNDYKHRRRSEKSKSKVEIEEPEEIHQHSRPVERRREERKRPIDHASNLDRLHIQSSAEEAKLEEPEKPNVVSNDSFDEGEATNSSTSSSIAEDDELDNTVINGTRRDSLSGHEDVENEPQIKRSKTTEVEEVVEQESFELEPKPEEKEILPPYLPAIMGCRSVSEFQCLNKIEEGTYGVVYRAQDKRTEEIVALKRLKMEREKEGFPITSLREVSTLLKAQHENIVTVREIVVGSNMDSIFMVMDYVEHDLKSLMEVLKSRKQMFLPGEVKCLLQQLLRGVAHMHDNWILHRDLKTSNILLSHSGILKVGDFGLAREYGSPLKAYTSIVVTLWYRAPELLLGAKEYSTPIDVWSVGCIFGELLTLEAIFQGKFEADQINKIFRELGTPNDNIWPGYSDLPMVKKATFTNNPSNNLRKRFSTRLSELGIDLMQKFLTYDPQKRITAEEALNHTYLKEPPYPIHPSMLPTWPAKSESHGPRKAQSPKPPSGGRAYKQLNDEAADEASAGSLFDRQSTNSGSVFCLKF